MREQPENLSGVRIHPPVLTLIHLLAAFLLGWLAPLPFPAPGWLPLAGWGIVLAGLALAFWAIVHFRRSDTTLEPHGGTSVIVTDGPYRFTRNPIYIGYVCFLVGFPLVIDSYWGLVLAPLLIVLMNWLVIRYEEAYLAARFGSEYLAFKSSVRRWL